MEGREKEIKMGWWNWSYSKRGGTIALLLRLFSGLLLLFGVINFSFLSAGIFPEAFLTRFLDGLFAGSTYGALNSTFVTFLSWVEVLFYWYLIGAFIGGIIGKIRFRDINKNEY
jgi:hypothetical protein